MFTGSEHVRCGISGQAGGWWGPELYDDAHGIAVCLPGAGAPAHYADLVWAKYSNRDEFIAWLAQP